MKTVNEVGRQKDYNGIDHQQEKAQRENGDGQGENDQNRLHQKVEQAQHDRYNNGGHERVDPDPGQQIWQNYHGEGTE